MIGYKGVENKIEWTFTPEAQFAPGLAGVIKLYMPYLYQIGQSNVMPYNPRAFNKCSSDCFATDSSALFGQHLEI